MERIRECRSRAERRRTSGGLTLIELMIVVAIVAVLAVVAVVTYKKIVASSRVSEATHMVQGIRAAQDRYKAETGNYANISSSITQFYPAASPGAFKTQWGAACTLCTNGWNTLAVKPDGPLEFGYATVAGSASTAAPTITFSDGNTATWPTTNTGPWFIVQARGDTDGNGKSCSVVGSSYGNGLTINQEGE
jgi:type IV pilus assembly protein PilA